MCPSGRGTPSIPAVPTRGSPRTSFLVETSSSSRFACRRISANKEVVWTLTTNGKTEKAYGTLRPQYAVDETVMMANFGAGGQTGFCPT